MAVAKRNAEAARTRDLARVLGALADENRIKIVACLAGGTRCVCELTEMVRIPQNLMSHHLRVLRERGIVQTERRGRWVYYSLRRRAMQELAMNINHIHDFKSVGRRRSPLSCDEKLLKR